MVKRWKAGIVDDISLPSTGFEITTAPANGDKFHQQILEICSTLADAKATVNADCGLHVHVDARDFSYWDIRRLIKVYARIENALFSVVPPSRRSSSYCQRCGVEYLSHIDDKPSDAKKGTISATYPDLADTEGQDLKDKLSMKKGNKYDRARYHALNLHSWFFRGTVECRMGAGSVNAEKITFWATLWAHILDYVAKASEAQIAKLPADSWECLLAIAPASHHNWLKNRREKFA